MEATFNLMFDKLEMTGQTKPDQVLKAMKAANLLKPLGKSEGEVKAMLVARAENGKVPKPAFEEIIAELLVGGASAPPTLQMSAQAATKSDTLEVQLSKIYEKLASSGQTQPDQVLKAIKDAKFFCKSEDEVKAMLVAKAENGKVSKPVFKEITAALLAGAPGAASLQPGATTSQSAAEDLGVFEQAAGVLGEFSDRLQEAMDSGAAWISAAPIPTTSASTQAGLEER